MASSYLKEQGDRQAHPADHFKWEEAIKRLFCSRSGEGQHLSAVGSSGLVYFKAPE